MTHDAPEQPIGSNKNEDTGGSSSEDEELPPPQPSPSSNNFGRDDRKPVLTRVERARDAWIRLMEHPRFLVPSSLFLLACIAGFGGFLLCLLFGWHAVCRPRFDCEPRNFYFNACVQLLNALFTVKALCVLPGRVAHFRHGQGWTRRCNGVGCDLHGVADSDTAWFHVALSRRNRISAWLLGECLFQCLNQATRVIYYDYESSTQTAAGMLWTSGFLVVAIVSGATGSVGYVRALLAVQRSDPGRFGVPVTDALRAAHRQHGWRHMWVALYRERHCLRPQNPQSAYYCRCRGGSRQGDLRWIISSRSSSSSSTTSSHHATYPPGTRLIEV